MNTKHSDTRYVLIRVEFSETTNDRTASKYADSLVEVAGGYGDAFIVDEGVMPQTAD